MTWLKGEFYKICIFHIYLFHQTVTKQVGKSIKKGLEIRSTNFTFYALVIKESTDATNISQMAIFIKGVDNKYNITEEITFLIPLRSTKKL